ncbi:MULTISPECIES: TetR/AcrR family transcriptional regulator [unclassified Modestobacter]
MSSVTSPASSGAARPLRADAERNRLAILAAAQRVFAVRGLDVGFDVIAREAGVGAATVYRRFPERADLIEALFEQEIDDVVAHLEAAAADPDPWAGLCRFLRWGIEAQAHNRGLAQVLAEAGRGNEDLDRGRQRIEPLAGALIARVQAAGVLRPDVTPLDLLLPATLLSRVGAPEDAGVRERLLVLLLDGLVVRRDAPTPLPASPPTEAHVADVTGARRPTAH